MPFHPWLTILVCLVFAVSGCVKAVEKGVVTPTPVPRAGLVGPYDGDIPKPYRERLLSAETDDGTIPWIFLAVAGHFEAGGDEERAFHFLDRAAEAFAGRREPAGEGDSLCRKVLLLLDMDRQIEALDLMRQASERWSSTPLRAFPEYLEGRLALRRGDPTRARELLRRSLGDNENFRTHPSLLRLRRDAQLAAGMAAVLSAHLPSLLAAYRVQETFVSGGGMDGESEAHLREALALNRELRQSRTGGFIPSAELQRVEAGAYAFMGLDRGMRGDAAESLRRLIQAAELSRVAGDREGEILSLLFLGEVGLRGGNADQGRQAAAVLGQRADRLRVSFYRIWARLLLARYAQQQGQAGEAIALLKEADGLLRSRPLGPQMGMLARFERPQRRALYQFLVELTAAEGRTEEALDASEKAKSLRVAEILAGQDLGASPAERELLRQEVRLGETIRHLETRLLHLADEARSRELLGRLEGAEESYRDLIARFQGEAERLLALIRVRGVALPALQGLLDENTTLFDYFSTERGLYVWAIHHQGVHLERIELSREKLRALVFAFLDAVEKRGKRRTEGIYRRAYDLLLKPVIPFVSGERIGFIPDDCLVYFPFAAMNYRGRFLAEGFTLFQLPAAGLLGPLMAGKVTQGMKILAFGDPILENEELDLHHARQELEQIRKRGTRTTVLLQSEASEAKAAQMMAGYDVLHFAVRAQFHSDSPLNSGLLLTPGAGQDGTLTTLEIFRLRYPGQTIVLSGCDTRPREDPEGSGLPLLQRAFLHAGSPSVISTLWLVDDRAAAHLLDLFYRQLGRKESPADALRAAQLHLSREGYPPYIWAAFVLTGRY
jgi:CHAT domain-containing protein